MIKTLKKSVRQYRLPSLLTPLFVSLEVVCEVTMPLLMSKLIDNGIYGGSIPTVLKLGVCLLAFALVSMLFGALAGRFAAVASCGFAKNLRQDMYYAVQKYSFSNIDKFSTASIVTRLTTDVTNVQNAYQMLIRMAVRSPMMMIISLAVSFSINVPLSLIFLAAIPILGGVLYVIMTHAHPTFEKVFNTYDRLNNVVQENVRGVRVVKSFVREDYEINKFNGISEKIYRLFTKAEKLLAFNMPSMQIAMYACTLLVSWLGARIIVGAGAGGSLTTGNLTTLLTYATQILMSLMGLSMVFVMITISRASMERIAEILTEQSDITDPENPITEVSDGRIVFDNVTFRYSRTGEKPVLDHINLTIPSGATVGIIGGTGSSKSSLVQLIPRLYNVTEGSVTVGGHDVREYAIKPLRDSVAMVLQKNELFSGTVAENLRWGNENASDDELREACRLACADGFIESFPDKYETHIEQGGANVSGGQKQRLTIARALLKKPKILILDDSTSAVDTRTDAQIRGALAQHIPDTTKIIIAQRAASVEHADIIVVMDDGRISAVGNHEQLMKESKIYKEVYTSQMKGGSDDE